MPVHHFVSDLAALEAIASTQRTDSQIKFVRVPETGLLPALYWYEASSTASALGSVVSVPDDNPTTGRWLLSCSGLSVHRATAKPASAPPAKNILWQASIGAGTAADPDRRIFYLSVGTSSVSDWVPFGNEPVISTAGPTGVFTPDYIGQQLIDTTGDVHYIASGATDSDWVTT